MGRNVARDYVAIGSVGRADRLRMAVLVDRDVGEIAVGHEDRLHLPAAQHPGFEMHGDRGAADANEVGVDRDEIADIDGLAKIHRLDRDRDSARLRDLGANTPPPTSIWLSSQPPKMSPFWLVSAGIASVRMQRSPLGAISVHDVARDIGRSQLKMLLESCPSRHPARSGRRISRASARKVETTFSTPRVRA